MRRQGQQAPIADRSVRLAPVLRELWPYVWPSGRPDLRRRIFVALGLLVLAKFATVATPFAFKWAIDALVAMTKGGASAKTLAGPIALTFLYGALRVVMAGLTQARDGVFADVAMNAVRRLAADVFVHLHALSMRFHLERKTGALTRVLERGRNAIETLTRMVTLNGLPTALEFTLILGVMLFHFDWRYAAITLATIAAYLSFTRLATNWRIGIRRSMNESDSDANSKAIDSLLNYETVKYFGAERRETARYDRSMARYERNSVKSYVSLAVLNFGQAFIFTLGMVSLMALSVTGIRAGRYSVGDFVMLNAMLIQLYQPLNYMGLLYREVKQAIVDIDMMFEILKQPNEIAEAPHAPPLRVTSGVLRFENVHFAYDPARAILRGVSFEVPAGRTLALVGASGAGKSTISRLIFRFFDPQHGRILIDGQDIAKVSLASLRGALGMVPQDNVLFNDTVRYNLLYGRPDATEEEMREAARLAQIDKFIESAPGGYEAQVGERGLKLSGGEKQRVAIARTLLKAPPILVLDEATSALDTVTERDIQGALDEAARGRTTIVIAHRLSTIVHADEILVLDKGKIVERGSHESLLALDGAYAALWRRQLRERDEAEASPEEAAPAVTAPEAEDIRHDRDEALLRASEI
ncbi:ABC transporter ATP-binding protein/permease [Rhodoblastus acidophilus]|uniref:ABC transporter ATP-binding protein/permease n=1 Tax=Candidatus Rhodoblastus alkanivorans TaxID=2954117 RepID=A0ABS9Z2X3_9HYPH|nr:ABC transporter ATP-binding protein/permease [Candidatus Rhodoblastus alkanivorans]MCI4677274.1 ABC transporter ATP-binding protein/permease [Candidatus Rhodoblastus alkanivorans]MCI4682009.1 ABC transporter ATP-binding protein/permease [Candidatus Rhodoblastus alkanivorans]MDI4643060.1 ABC transporter ATP-binding protein/permease [Rhodoblastus acidophilus]